MSGLLHKPHCFNRFVMAEDGIWQRREVARSEQRQHVREQALRDIRPRREQLVEIDTEITQVPTEGPQPDRSIGEIVALAEFDKPSERPQEAEAALHGFACKRIENHRDSVTLGRTNDIIDKGAGARVEMHTPPQRRASARASHLIPR